MTDKSIVILDNFWNANYLINCGFVMFPFDKDKYYKINLSQKDNNYTVLSIALRHPPLDDKLPHLGNINTLSFFCPTYNMLNRYKKDGNWDNYTKDYRALLRKRKTEIREWIESLKPNHVYILCCWENTALKAKCHRQILYEAFKTSSLAKEKIIPFYCNGDKKMNLETVNPYYAQIMFPVSGTENILNGNYYVSSYSTVVLNADATTSMDPGRPQVYPDPQPVRRRR